MIQLVKLVCKIMINAVGANVFLMSISMSVCLAHTFISISHFLFSTHILFYALTYHLVTINQD